MANKLIIGLGNPGRSYVKTRHNTGYMVVDALARIMTNDQWSMIKKLQSLVINYQPSLILAKPTTFMNESGKTVKKLVDHFKIKTPDLWVVHDDLDIELGGYKIQFGKGPRLHKGIISIEKELGRNDFWRVRVGVDNREKDKKVSGQTYVLQNFEESEQRVLKETIGKITKELISKLTN